VGLFFFQEKTMTRNNLFGPERKPPRLKLIRPIYEFTGPLEPLVT
jgi:hypothetical protein